MAFPHHFFGDRRMSPSGYANAPVPQEAAPRRPAESAPSERSYEEHLREAARDALQDAEALLRSERRANEQGFALERFIRHGGNEILKKFTPEQTVNALMSLCHGAKKDVNAITFLDLTKRLLPHASDRAAFHASMIETAARSFLEAEKSAAARRPTQADAEQRDSPIDASYVHSVELVARACANEDDTHFLHNPVEQELLREAIQPLVHSLLNNPELGERIRRHGLLATMRELDAERDRSKGERMDALAKVTRELDAAIRKINAEEERNAKPDIEGIAHQLSRIAASAGQQGGPSLIEQITPVTQALEAQKRALQERIIRRTHHLSALLSYARKLAANT